MVERPDETHSLVEIFLGEGGARRDPAMEAPEAIEQLRALGPAGKSVGRRRRILIVGLGKSRLRHGHCRCEQIREDELAHSAPPCGTAHLSEVRIDSNRCWSRSEDRHESPHRLHRRIDRLTPDFRSRCNRRIPSERLHLGSSALGGFAWNARARRFAREAFRWSQQPRRRK